FYSKRLAEACACVGNGVIGNVFEDGTIAKVDGSVLDGRLAGSTVDPGGRRRGQQNVRSVSLMHAGHQGVATQNTSSGIQKHEIRGAVFHLERSERLKRQGIPALTQNCAAASSLESEVQEAIAAGA